MLRWAANVCIQNVGLVGRQATCRQHPHPRDTAMTSDYLPVSPSRAEVDRLPGTSVLDFGTNWCGHCRAAAPLVATALAARPSLRHMKVEDGPGRALGRSFGVKLWPTLVFLRDGQECARLVRPRDAAAVAEALALLGD